MLTVVFGRRGSGKTTLIRHLIPQFKKPVFVIDVLGNYTPGDTEKQNNSDWDLSTSPEDALDALLWWRKNPKESSGIIVVQGGELPRAIDFVSSALWKIHGGTLVLDEADFLSISEAPCFDELIRYGRNHGIDLITGCRRPAELSKNITAGADLAYCLVTHEPRDIDYYRDFLGDELAFSLPQLPPHHGIYKDFLNLKDGRFKTDRSGKITLLKSKVRRFPSQEVPSKIQETETSQLDLDLEPELNSDDEVELNS